MTTYMGYHVPERLAGEEGEAIPSGSTSSPARRAGALPRVGSESSALRPSPATTQDATAVRDMSAAPVASPRVSGQSASRGDSRYSSAHLESDAHTKSDQGSSAVEPPAVNGKVESSNLSPGASSVLTQADHGMRGWLAGLANATHADHVRHGRMGGRPRNPSWLELQAGLTQGTTGSRNRRLTGRAER